jgi:hypothetical protein
VIASTGHGAGLTVFPVTAAFISAVFGFRLAQGYIARQRASEGIWALALLMYAGASFAMSLGVVRGWEPVDYRLYWLLGAVLNVPYLLVGEVFLLSPWKSLARTLAVVVLGLTVLAAVLVLRAPVSVQALSSSLPLGKDVFGTHAWPYRLAQLYSIPAYVLLLAGLVWSVWKMRGKPHLRERMLGTFGVALGATIVAIGSGIGAAFHIVPLFSIALALGVAVMFWGFLQASRSRITAPAAGAAPPPSPA